MCKVPHLFSVVLLRFWRAPLLLDLVLRVSFSVPLISDIVPFSAFHFSSSTVLEAPFLLFMVLPLSYWALQVLWVLSGYIWGCADAVQGSSCWGGRMDRSSPESFATVINGVLVCSMLFFWMLFYFVVSSPASLHCPARFSSCCLGFFGCSSGLYVLCGMFVSIRLIYLGWLLFCVPLLVSRVPLQRRSVLCLILSWYKICSTGEALVR